MDDKNNPTNENQNGANKQMGLTYDSNEVLGDLVNQDTDSDGVPDWEEGLWGTDANKKDTDGDGVPDDIEIENLKKENVKNGNIEIKPIDEKNLTETDKFSRDFFSTVATLNQTGGIDQATADKLTESITEHMENSAAKKVFTASDIKVVGETKEATQSYADTIALSFKKHTVNVAISDILSEALTSDGNIDVKALDKLDPIIEQIRGIVNDMSDMKVPESLLLVHLEAINSFEKIAENLSDIKLVDQDVIVAMSAVSQYEKNDENSKTAIQKLIAAIDGKLNN